MKGLARLEIDWAVLDLQDDVGRELAVQRRKLVERLLCSIGRPLAGIDEGSPQQRAAMRRERGCQYIGAFGMGPAVGLGAGLAFGIGLDEKAPEVGDQAV